MREQLKSLEQLRLELQTATHQLGSADYRFERWLRKNNEIADEAYTTIMAEQEKIKRIEPLLNELVATLRQQQPALIDEWVDFHQMIVREALAKFEQGPLPSEITVRNHRLEAAELLEKWEAVRRGEQATVLYSPVYFDHSFRERPRREL